MGLWRPLGIQKWQTGADPGKQKDADGNGRSRRISYLWDRILGCICAPHRS